LIVIVASAVYFANNGAAPIGLLAIQTLSWSLAAISFLVLYPQLLFKPQERTLTLDERGVSTAIGRHSGSRSWAEISSIHEDGDYIVLRSKKGNAFIVPPRAFPTAEERTKFLAFAERAKAAARPS
jgi:hypothetical protein